MDPMGTVVSPLYVDIFPNFGRHLQPFLVEPWWLHPRLSAKSSKFKVSQEDSWQHMATFFTSDLQGFLVCCGKSTVDGSEIRRSPVDMGVEPKIGVPQNGW